MRTWNAKAMGALVLGVLVLGPAPARAADRDVPADMKHLRERGGVCASEIQGVTLASYLQPIVCIGVGTPFTVSDSHEPWMYVEIQTDPQHLADAKEWKLTVTGPDGKRILDARPLAKEKPQSAANECSGVKGCRQSAVALKAPAWKAGRYLFHLVYQPDPEIVSDLSITLR